MLLSNGEFSIGPSLADVDEDWRDELLADVNDWYFAFGESIELAANAGLFSRKEEAFEPFTMAIPIPYLSASRRRCRSESLGDQLFDSLRCDVVTGTDLYRREATVADPLVCGLIVNSDLLSSLFKIHCPFSTRRQAVRAAVLRSPVRRICAVCLVYT
jgi:hypothetical protein